MTLEQVRAAMALLYGTYELGYEPPDISHYPKDGWVWRDISERPGTMPGELDSETEIHICTPSMGMVTSATPARNWRWTNNGEGSDIAAWCVP